MDSWHRSTESLHSRSRRPCSPSWSTDLVGFSHKSCCLHDFLESPCGDFVVRYCSSTLLLPIPREFHQVHAVQHHVVISIWDLRTWRWGFWCLGRDGTLLVAVAA